MTTRGQVLIPISIAAVIIGVVGLMTMPSEIKLESVEFPMGTIKVDDIPLQVMIADTEPRRVRGLMFEDQLPYDQGMIFVFEKSGLYSLWMLNMQFSLDMIWFDQDGRVVHIETDVPPCKTALESQPVKVLSLMQKRSIFLKLHPGLLIKIILQKILY